MCVPIERPCLCCNTHVRAAPLFWSVIDKGVPSWWSAARKRCARAPGGNPARQRSQRRWFQPPGHRAGQQPDKGAPSWLVQRRELITNTQQEAPAIFATPHLLGGALRKEDVHQRLVDIQPTSSRAAVAKAFASATRSESRSATRPRRTFLVERCAKKMCTRAWWTSSRAAVAKAFASATRPARPPRRTPASTALMHSCGCLSGPAYAWLC